MSTRLSVSDNEGESVSYWELQSPATQWEKVSNSGSTLNRYESHRSYFHRSGRNALEPVIAKTLLHEPRILNRSPKTSPTRYSASRFVRNHLQSSKLRFGSEKDIQTSKKKRNVLKKTMSVREPDGELFVRNRLRRNSICIDVRSNEGKSEPTSQRSKTPSIESSQSSPNMFIISDATDVNRKSPLMSEKSKPVEVDEDHLCADIAGCDTLFMDIGAKETPQLKAARNLKERIIKKKALNDITKLTSSSPVNQDPNGNELLGNEQNTNVPTPSDNTTLNATTVGAISIQNEQKPKKKIKIIIGKRPKQKTSRKKLLPDLD